MGDDSYAWFGVILSTASAVGQCYGLGVCTKRRLGDILMEMGGMMARRKVSKSAQNIFNNQQRLAVTLEDSGGVAQMGGDDDR